MMKAFKEPKDVEENLRQGECGVRYFKGQTHIYIPKRIFVCLGRERIRSFIQEIFGEEDGEELERYEPFKGEYQNSYLFEVPSVVDPMTGERDAKKKIGKLVNLLIQNI